MRILDRHTLLVKRNWLSGIGGPTFPQDGLQHPQVLMPDDLAEVSLGLERGGVGPAQRGLSGTPAGRTSGAAFITKQTAVPAPSAWVHPPGKRSAHDTPSDAVRAGLGTFFGEVTTTSGSVAA